MAQPGTVVGWKLPHGQRQILLERFRPKYANVIADHVTLRVGAALGSPLPARPRSARIVGHADDGAGLECLVVEVEGTTDRPDGSTYHITWSMEAARKARESNDVLRDCGWRSLASPATIDLEPARF